ncbi:MAG TPA: hypothetical protein VEI01_25660 [Terriglobales bacterium]|nr:hypothetical protein [Terriglobales bacterium]
MATVRINPLDDPPDFSIVLGGPLFQLLRRAHLEGDHLELLYRRLVFFVGITWLPLFLLATVGPFAGSAGRLAFLRDIEVHARFLVALPAFIVAELLVHLRMLPVARRFVERRIILSEDLPRFYRAVESAFRLRNSIPLELGLFAAVYTFGLWFWHSRFGIEAATWYSMPGGRWHLTPAGAWYVFVSIPILQFMLLRWYVRFFIWYRFLWQVSRITLDLIPTHPDRTGGLGFLGGLSYTFGPVLFGQGAMLAGLIASNVLYHGGKLLSFKLQAGSFVVFFVGVIFGPLLMFTAQMARARRKGLAEYGLLAQRYVADFRERWIVGRGASSEELLGTGDIQSLADLGNSYTVVQEMRIVPFGLRDVSRLAAATAAPMVPLLLLVWSPEEVIMRVMKVVF